MGPSPSSRSQMSCPIVRRRSVPVILAFAVCWKPRLSSRSIHRFPQGKVEEVDYSIMTAGVIPNPCAPAAYQPWGQCHRSSSSEIHQPGPPDSSQMLVDIITSGGGCLDDMEACLERLGIVVTPALVAHIIHSCGTASAAGRGGPKGGVSISSSSCRRLLRFFSWCRSKIHEELGDEVFNQAIRAFAEMKDLTAMWITILDLQKEGRRMDPQTFICVSETLVRSDRAGEAVRLFRCTQVNDKKQQPLLVRGGGWSSVVTIVHALCDKGQVLEARRIFWHHKDKLAVGEPSIIYRSLLHGWCLHGNAREARRVIDEMRLLGICPGLLSYHDFLRCICKRNLKFNPSALVAEATVVMTEMRCSGVPPTAVSFNILLSFLGRSRRVKEACQILVSMIHGEAGCSPDWVSYYHVVRVLYLTGRFIRGQKVMDKMIKEGVMPVERFYHGLIGILCGMEKVDHALKVFEHMTMCCGLNNGPTFDLLITKLCRNGMFDIGRSLWNEAIAKGITLQCSNDLLDPLKITVFKPKKEKLDAKNDNRVVQTRKKVAVSRKGKVQRKKGHAT